MVQGSLSPNLRSYPSPVAPKWPFHGCRGNVGGRATKIQKSSHGPCQPFASLEPQGAEETGGKKRFKKSNRHGRPCFQRPNNLPKALPCISRCAKGLRPKHKMCRHLKEEICVDPEFGHILEFSDKFQTKKCRIPFLMGRLINFVPTAYASKPCGFHFSVHV